MMVTVAGAAQAQTADMPANIGLIRNSVQVQTQATVLPYRHLVVLGDPHLPGRNPAAKEKVIQTLNSWSDVDSVVVLGDLCADVGTQLELEYARRFFKRLGKSQFVIHGNHDYVYCDERDSAGNRVKGAPQTRQFKLNRFMDAFELKSPYYSKRVGEYLAIFLSADDLHSDSVTCFSEMQLAWWQAEMESNKGIPTIVFCHAPLHGTVSIVREGTAAAAGALGALLMGGPQWAFPAAYLCDSIVRWVEERQMAQPVEKIRRIVESNPQLFLWVSGHFHVTGTNRTFNSTENVYRKQVTLVHNSDMDGWGFHSPWQGWRHDTIWTNSLYLYPDRVDIRTYDHTAGSWLEKMDRTVRFA